MAGIVVLASAAGCIAAPPAQAYRLTPARWAGHTIPYFNGAKRYAREVRVAQRAWNHSGVHMRWKPVSRGRARVVVKITRHLPPAGLATVQTLGDRVTRATIQLRPDLRTNGVSPGEGHAVAAAIIAHEMGHVMGLAHEDRRCATMNTTLWMACKPPSQPWRYHCRTLERDDVRGVARIYGGHARPLHGRDCDAVAEPAAPTGLTVTIGPGGQPHLSWTMPGGPVESVRVLRRRDTCPTGPEDPLAQPVEEAAAAAGAAMSLDDASVFESGRYCYAVLAVASYLRPGALATAFVDFAGAPGGPAPGPPIASFDYFQDDGAGPRTIQFLDQSYDDGVVVAWAWDFGDGATSAEPNPVHAYATAGEKTVVLTVTDDAGETDATVVSVHVDDPPPPGA